MKAPFGKILIANRGEIACRVIRSAKALGIATVAVASEADRDARHARLADETIVIGPPPVAQSYLDGARLIDAARRSGAEAVHPGYGFLSENADFAQACIDAGLVFIGPSPEAIRAMGDKAEAKRRMIAAGVPCIPGYEGSDQDDARLIAEAAAIGFPVMVKASAGGGGRGMRLVQSADLLPAALASARSEAKGAFGDGTLLLERALTDARHVEVQILGDLHGNIVHLGERDCSIQRRHQKIVEEAPSPAVDAGLRARMGAAAVQAARSIDYAGAGTVEFLLDSSGEFYFLEMNTRLQVEHPVTEFVTGLDLVALQLKVAAGVPLPFAQDDLTISGHAIEVRLYAEDPANGFLPQTGRIDAWRPACGRGIRIDHGIDSGMIVTPHYDPMLAKLIAHGADREEARRRLVRALEETVLLGVMTNRDFLIRVLEAPAFAAGDATTHFIEHFETDLGAPNAEPEIVALAAALFADAGGGGWRSNRWAAHPILLAHRGESVELLAWREADDWVIDHAGETRRITLMSTEGEAVRWACDGHLRNARYIVRDAELHLDTGRAVHIFRDETYALPETAAAAAGDIRAPMNGTIVAVRVAPGDRVTRGQLLLVLEAMKMEHQITAPADGTIEALSAAMGDQVASRAILVTLRAEEDIPA